MNQKDVGSRKGQWRWALPVAVVGLVLAGCGRDDESVPAGAAAMPPMPVTVAVVHAEDVDVMREYAGRARGAREVEVRARVSGILEERLYTEGQVVKEGDALFRIDAKPYEIALLQFQAEAANAEADLRQADREWRRVSNLFEQNAVSERERDTVLSRRELAEARLALSQARVAGAQLDLDYTVARAPLSGPTGLESFPEGSLIERGALLTTIVQNDPVHVRFSLPEGDAALQRAAARATEGGSSGERRAVALVSAGGRELKSEGEVDFTDSIIDPRTGTVSMRAVFANPNGAIVPGQFVRARMLLERLQGVFPIDPVAIGEGRQGPQVFVLQDDNTVEARPVRLGPVVGGRRVVLEGLKAGDRVVVNGQVALRNGMTVAVQSEVGRNQ